MRNGRFWSQLAPDDPVKAFYVLGLLDGWELRDRVPGDTNTDLIEAMAPRRNNLPIDLAKMLTLTYGEAENLRLTVGWVVLGSMAVIRGDTDRERMLAALRKYLSEVEAGDSRTNGSQFSAYDVVKVISALKHQKH
jgi:hypothetical protein